MTARLEQAQRELKQAQDTLKGFYSSHTTEDREKALCEALEGLLHVATYLLHDALLRELGQRARDEREHDRSYVDSVVRGWR